MANELMSPRKIQRIAGEYRSERKEVVSIEEIMEKYKQP
jgi:hypothetical protein